MSSTIFNNRKRHYSDRAVYSGAPHSSKKRVRHEKNIENIKKQNFKFNLGGLAVAFVIWFSLEGDPLLKAVAGICAIISSFHYWESEER